MKAYPLATCPHSWIPLRRYPQYALCFYCEGKARWSTVLGCYIRIIPESHLVDGGQWRHPMGRKLNRSAQP